MRAHFLFLVWTLTTMSHSLSFIPLPNSSFPRIGFPPTPLDLYAQTPPGRDGAGYSVFATDAYPGKFNATVLKFQSGQWGERLGSSRPTWTHWLTVCAPLTQQDWTSTALLFIDGSTNAATPDKHLSPIADLLCSSVDGIVGYLQNIPNEPMSFGNATGPLGEDDLIPYSFQQYLKNTSDSSTLLLFPMVRASVRAMTAMQLYAQTSFPTAVIENFVVSGGSKRGWTAWLTGAVDARVSSIVPIVLPVGRMMPEVALEWQAYGNVSWTLDSWRKWGIFHEWFGEGMKMLGQQIDPGAYMSRYTFPVFNIVATGDEFTLPDSTRYWFAEIPGENWLRVVPNTDHTMLSAYLEITSDIAAFFYLVAREIPRPRVSFSVHYSSQRVLPASISAQVMPPLYDVKAQVWSAVTPATGRRDFRWFVCGELSTKCIQPIFWLSSSLSGSSSFQVQRNAPPSGSWEGFLIQLDFNVSNQPFRVSSQLNVVPDTWPFPACSPQECG